ncbi:MAG: acyl-CoA dehydrogenase family protein [Myxococcales bacterium]|nr:acyl-CoA dehydrogenase family protein [Myxococcales bacterium]
MDFELTEDQTLLVDTVREFVKKESPVERMRKLRGTELGWDRKTWKQMGELGWLGVMFPESVGGAGMTFVEAGLILQELGTTLVPEPIIPLMVAGTAIARSGSPEQQERFLAKSLTGDESLAFAWNEEQSRHDVNDVKTRAEKTKDGFRLDGQKRWVLNGHAADHIVLSARSGGDTRSGDGLSLFVIDKDTPGVKIQAVQMMDSQKGALLELKNVELGRDRLLGEEGKAGPLLDHLMDYGAAATVCEASGILQSVLWMTRSYLMERKQFGAPIGSFQALQHRAVDMFVETELTKSVAMLAMIKADETDVAERHRAISAAKTSVIESGAFVTRQGIQLHGGIGVTDEHDVGLYFKRMHILATLFGDDAFHTARYAGLPSFTRGV